MFICIAPLVLILPINYFIGECMGTNNMASSLLYQYYCVREYVKPCLLSSILKMRYPVHSAKSLTAICGFVYSDCLNPTHMVWSITTNVKLAVNVSLLYFNIPIFNTNCETLFLAVAENSDSENFTKYCGHKQHWDVYLQHISYFEFKSQYYLPTKHGFSIIYSILHLSLLLNKNQILSFASLKHLHAVIKYRQPIHIYLC